MKSVALDQNSDGTWTARIFSQTFSGTQVECVKWLTAFGALTFHRSPFRDGETKQVFECLTHDEYIDLLSKCSVKSKEVTPLYTEPMVPRIVKRSLELSMDAEVKEAGQLKETGRAPKSINPQPPIIKNITITKRQKIAIIMGTTLVLISFVPVLLAADAYGFRNLGNAKVFSVFFFPLIGICAASLLIYSGFGRSEQ